MQLRVDEKRARRRPTALLALVAPLLLRLADADASSTRALRLEAQRVTMSAAVPDEATPTGGARGIPHMDGSDRWVEGAGMIHGGGDGGDGGGGSAGSGSGSGGGGGGGGGSSSRGRSTAGRKSGGTRATGQHRAMQDVGDGFPQQWRSGFPPDADLNGWTLVLNIDTSDGNIVDYDNNEFWEGAGLGGAQATVDDSGQNGPFGSSDYKNVQAFTSLSPQASPGFSPKIMVVIHKNDVLVGTRAWSLATLQPLRDFFVGDHNARRQVRVMMHPSFLRKKSVSHGAF